MNETERIIKSRESGNGGWSKAALASFGISWPPVKGWKRTLIKTDALAGTEPERQLAMRLEWPKLKAKAIKRKEAKTPVYITERTDFSLPDLPEDGTPPWALEA